MVYMVGGVASARLQHTPMVLAYAYLPWVLYCCHRFTGAPTRGNAVFLDGHGEYVTREYAHTLRNIHPLR